MKSITVIRDGKTYEVPELWLTTRIEIYKDHETIAKAYDRAIALWIEQEKMSERLEEEI